MHSRAAAVDAPFENALSAVPRSCHGYVAIELPPKHIQPVRVISDEFSRNGIIPFLFVDLVVS